MFLYVSAPSLFQLFKPRWPNSETKLARWLSNWLISPPIESKRFGESIKRDPLLGRISHISPSADGASLKLKETETFK